MAKAIFVNSREFERDYKVPSGQIITLKIDDDWREITFYDQSGTKLDGGFQFEDDEDEQQRYLLARMYAPFTRAGLGRAALEFFIDITGASVYARQIEDEPDDGSHLTGDAPEFVDKMIKEGLLEDPNIGYVD